MAYKSETIIQRNIRNKIERKRLDKLSQEKIDLSSKQKTSSKAERKDVDTSPPWEGDMRFNARDKPDF